MANVGKRKTREQKREKEREKERNKEDQVVVCGTFTTDDSQAGIAVNCPFTKNVVPKGVERCERLLDKDEVKKSKEKSQQEPG